MNIFVSVVVPTFNRSGNLKNALNSFIKQKSNNFEFEILVVDNGSTDDTRQVIERFTQNNNVAIRYFLETRQGLHYARNTGIKNARGDIIVFGDDDIIAQEGWLQALVKPFLRDPKVGITGGKVLPLWKTKPPDWIYDYGSDKVHGVFAIIDLGNTPLILKTGYVFGCNFAIRRSLAFDIGGSPPDTFPPSKIEFSGSGECEMIEDIRKMDYKVVYEPDALVLHHADISRATPEYFIYRYKRLAVENVYSHCRRYGFLEGFGRSFYASARQLTYLVYGLYAYRKKRRPGLFFRIVLTQNLFQLRQLFFVMLNPAIRENIRRMSFIDSL